jgi:hypothetical protein
MISIPGEIMDAYRLGPQRRSGAHIGSRRRSARPARSIYKKRASALRAVTTEYLRLLRPTTTRLPAR